MTKNKTKPLPQSKPMSLTLVDIGSLITSSPDIQKGRPIITGTGTSVRLKVFYA